jgi:hypothetical protein
VTWLDGVKATTVMAPTGLDTMIEAGPHFAVPWVMLEMARIPAQSHMRRRPVP